MEQRGLASILYCITRAPRGLAHTNQSMNVPALLYAAFPTRITQSFWREINSRLKATPIRFGACVYFSEGKIARRFVDSQSGEERVNDKREEESQLLIRTPRKVGEDSRIEVLL